jgi:hypothetical protein
MHNSGNVLLAPSKNLRSSKLHLSERDTQAAWAWRPKSFFNVNRLLRLGIACIGSLFIVVLPVAKVVYWRSYLRG